MKIFNSEKLRELDKKNVQPLPFPHLVINGLWDDNLLKNILDQYPRIDDQKWWVYNNQLEKKFAFNQISLLPDVFSKLFSEVQNESFVELLQQTFGFKKLISDPSLRGGGLHQIASGGKLDIHEDFNIHLDLGAFRRLNMIVYLNEEWDDNFGGHLELWDADMTSKVKSVAPRFNTTVFFRTDMCSNHGHPEPLACPEGMTRKSLAVYYYEKTPEVFTTSYKSTVYKKRPQDPDDPAIDELRSRRISGRIEDKTT